MKTLSSTIRTAASFFALSVLAAVPTNAQTSAFTVSPSAQGADLQILDLGTGDLTPIGPIELPPGQFGPNAIAFLPSGGLVGVGRACETLVSIDPVTGQTTVVGDLGINPPDPLTVRGLAADPCGRLWMVCSLPAGSESLLYQVDTVTGAAELRGPLPAPLYGLATAGSVLYGFDLEVFESPRIMSVDPFTLEMSEIAAVGGLAGWTSESIDFDQEGELVSLGRLVPPTIPTPLLPQEVAHLSLSGEIDSRVEIPHDGTLYGLAVTAPTGECLGGSLAIPTTSPGALVLLVVLLAGAGAILVWRRG